MRRWRNSPLRCESGANAVEFALVSVFVMFPLIFGGITAAWAWNAQQTLSHAAREGARFGATLPDAGDPPGSADWRSTVEVRTEDAAHGLDLSDVSVCAKIVEGGPVTTEPTQDSDRGCFRDEVSGSRVHVQIRKPVETFTFFLPSAWTDGFDVSSDGVAKYELGDD